VPAAAEAAGRQRTGIAAKLTEQLPQSLAASRPESPERARLGQHAQFRPVETAPSYGILHRGERSLLDRALQSITRPTS